ncbi:hypothetical protein BH09PSE2_BH09PSE2_01660 [soil metagenome]
MRFTPHAARLCTLVALVTGALAAPCAFAQSAGSSAPYNDTPRADVAQTDDARFAFHAQSTFVAQGHDRFDSAFRGANSLSSSVSARETWDVTFYGGVRLWNGAEIWVNPEVDQGFGLSNTLGAAGFPSGEAYKVGAGDPYLRLQRFFFRQTFDLPGDKEKQDADLNQFAGTRSANRVAFTFGKLSVGDIFDTNAYAHDPRGDFLNWSLIDAGSFDYAADAWGYSAGGALEWYEGRWTLRGGAFLLSNVPNSTQIDTRFKQFQLIGEVEERHTWFGRPGKLKLTGFLSRGRIGRLDDATRLGLATASPADPALVRRYATRPGVSVNLEQSLSDDLGLFARAGWADGRFEAYEFTDIDRSISAGLSMKGARWGRPSDTVALAGVVNEASAARERFLDAGGLGILIGDGRLPHAGSERVAESYYDLAAPLGVHLALDYQRIVNPSYNRDRGPVSVLALRVHDQF